MREEEQKRWEEWRPGVRETMVLRWACIPSELTAAYPKPTPPMLTFPHAITAPTNKIKTLKRLGETRKMTDHNKVETHGFFSP